MNDLASEFSCAHLCVCLVFRFSVVPSFSSNHHHHHRARAPSVRVFREDFFPLRSQKLSRKERKNAIIQIASNRKHSHRGWFIDEREWLNGARKCQNIVLSAGMRIFGFRFASLFFNSWFGFISSLD